MNAKQIQNDDFKILIDALKYTSNIIVDITNKLTEQENKINKIENAINKLHHNWIELNSKLIHTNTHVNTNTNTNTNTNIQNKSQNKSNKKNKKSDSDDSEEISSFLIEKTNNKNNTIEIGVDSINNKLGNSIF